jgi:hypothetical protein
VPKVDSERLHYGRFAISPFRSGQANTVGIALRIALLGGVEGTCITRAKSEKVTHEYSTISGIQPLTAFSIFWANLNVAPCKCLLKHTATNYYLTNNTYKYDKSVKVWSLGHLHFF